jgi:peroxiredoxin
MNTFVYNQLKVLLSLTLLFALVITANADAQKPQSGLAPETVAPPLALPDLTGKVVHLKEYRGKVVVLNFFAFWCDTWKDEWPHLLKLAKLRETEKFAIVCASVDGSRQQLFRQLTGGNAPFPVLMDSKGYASKAFNITHVPTVMVLDKNGVVRYAHSGYPGDSAVLAAVRKAR